MKHTPRGYWLEEAGTVGAAPPLAGDLEADVVVIGGGYTGMWTAWHLTELEPEARIVLLEGAERCGLGPSGRNGGFCNAMWLALPNMRERWGAEGALAVARAAVDAVDGIEDFCAAEGVDAWFRRAGYLKVSTAAAHDRTSADAVAACRELGEAAAVEELSGEEVAARCASPLFRGGVFFPDAATVQPARLALGLRERLLARGVEICESSALRSLRRRSDHVEARTEGGYVRADRAVLAIGGAAKGIRGPLRGRLSIASSHIVLTEPVPELLEEIGWTGGECITDSRALIDYFRTTPDGRIAFGWGGGRIALGARLEGRSELDPEVVGQTVEHLGVLFPGLEGTTVTHAWGGPIDASPAHLPLVLPLRGGRAFAAAGYTGNGVGPAHMVARTLASLALDRHDEASRLAFVDPSPPWVPPEPLHWIGGEAIRAGIQAKEEAELAGREPGLVSSTLARVPELIGFHIGR
jgi:glycine/D-amino acid oxidase-like deaminating enzyme